MGVRGKCPKCGKELDFPENMDRIICMYCGNPVKADELVMDLLTDDQKKQAAALEAQLENSTDPAERSRLITTLLAADSHNHAANLAYARDNIGRLIRGHTDMMKGFSEEHYEETFENYMEAEREVLEHLDLACYMHEEETPEILGRTAAMLVDEVETVLQEQKAAKVKKASILFDDFKMLQVVYIIPMIRETQLSISEEFSDRIIEEWAQRHPKDRYYKGDYHKLIEGFKRRKICYITTAVCETFGKPEYCYELMRFREFRDDYLLAQPDGKALVEEYYHVAPAVVQRIDARPDRREVYQGIWQEYLSPCLQAIETGRPEDCEKTYVDMVHSLCRKYLA